MSVQTLFGRAISNLLPSAIPTQLERINEFAIGKVLIYKKKPRKFLSWRHHELNFTGYSLPSLLADQTLTIATSSNFLFDAGKGTSSATVKVNLDAELSLRESLVKMEARLKEDEMKNLTITTDVGKVSRISTNLLPDCTSRNLKVKMDHPIVKEAIDKGGTLFVITSLYEAEHCKVEVKIAKEEDETLSAGVSAEVGAGGGETVGDSKTATQVISRDMPTPIAFLLLKLVIRDNGEIEPKLNSGLSHQLRKSSIEFIDSPDGRFPSKYKSSRFKTSESLDDWVVVDIVSGRTSQVMKVLTERPEESTPPQQDTIRVEEAQPQMIKEEVTVEQSPTLSSPPPPVVEEVAVKMVSDELYSPHPSSAAVDIPTPDIGGADQHYVYSIRDFQPFESTNYDGILKEARDWVRPLVSNKKLHSAFLEYSKPPQTFEKLEKLSEFLLDYGNALRTNQSTPKPPKPAMEPILENLSSSLSEKLEEVTSIIVTAEACTEFPQHIIKKAIALPNNKRYILVEFIRQTPYGADRHYYSDAGPFKDPDLYPIMTRMGFNIPSSSKQLVFTAPDDKEDDMLAAGLVMLLGTDIHN